MSKSVVNSPIKERYFKFKKNFFVKIQKNLKKGFIFGSGGSI